jgi:GNAT superfamily N-acetyltransferase
MNLLIRKVEAKDKEQVQDFFIQQVRNTFIENGLVDEENGIKSETDYKLKLLDKAISDNYPDEKLFIAILDNHIVGIGGYAQPNGLILSCDKDANIVIGSMFVDKAYRRNGVASSIINIIYDELRSRGETHYFLDSGYKNAQAIWQNKFGKPTYTLKDYWETDYHHKVWKIQLINKARI